ncbi:hypothetical protein AMTRI_Chr09g34750 [Amborella trichopoda]
MGTSCFVTMTIDFCFKSPAPLFELSLFFLFTVKVPLFNYFTFDEARPLLSEAMTHKSHPKSLFSLTTTSREKVLGSNQRCS